MNKIAIPNPYSARPPIDQQAIFIPLTYLRLYLTMHQTLKRHFMLLSRKKNEEDENIVDGKDVDDASDVNDIEEVNFADIFQDQYCRPCTVHTSNSRRDTMEWTIPTYG